MNDDELAAFLENGSDGEPSNGAAVRELRELLADEAVWIEPAPGGADALLEAIRAESAARPTPMPSPARRPAQAHRAGRWRFAVLAAAAAVVVVAGLATALIAGMSDDGGGREFAIAGTDLASEASARATVENLGSGVAIELDVRDLPPAEPGTYYQAWVKGPDGLVTIGTFHLRGGDDAVELWAGVDLERYPTLTVTIQQEGAGQDSSGEVVLTGEIGP